MNHLMHALHLEFINEILPIQQSNHLERSERMLGHKPVLERVQFLLPNTQSMINLIIIAFIYLLNVPALHRIRQ